MKSKQLWEKAARDTLPVLAGYIVLGIGFGLHVWRRNTLLSILAGTVSYMLLVQFVF